MNFNNENDHGNDMVTISVNEKAVSIHRGQHLISELKLAGGVPSTDILYKLPNYEVALNDDDKIIIHGGESFKSSAPSGASS
ncbi:MAG: hypothetical protein U9N81_04240 [Bacillota bacterium]|nr:hypothetical protein [Bacillota bacterium]